MHYTFPYFWVIGLFCYFLNLNTTILIRFIWLYPDIPVSMYKVLYLNSTDLSSIITYKLVWNGTVHLYCNYLTTDTHSGITRITYGMGRTGLTPDETQLLGRLDTNIRFVNHTICRVSVLRYLHLTEWGVFFSDSVLVRLIKVEICNIISMFCSILRSVLYSENYLTRHETVQTTSTALLRPFLSIPIFPVNVRPFNFDKVGKRQCCDLYFTDPLRHWSLFTVNFYFLKVYRFSTLNKILPISW